MKILPVPRCVSRVSKRDGVEPTAPVLGSVMFGVRDLAAVLGKLRDAGVPVGDAGADVLIAEFLR